eukprot:15455165-Alexandrium_andersonii.AAC.1
MEAEQAACRAAAEPCNAAQSAARTQEHGRQAGRTAAEGIAVAGTAAHASPTRWPDKPSAHAREQKRGRRREAEQANRPCRA